MQTAADHPSTNLRKYTAPNPVLKRLIDRFQDRCAALVAPLEIDTVLEVGCGEGFFLEFLRGRFPHWKMRGSDIGEEAIRFANSHVPGVDFSVESIHSLSDPGRSRDLVVASEVLEHLEDPEGALREILRVSRRYVLLSVPNEPAFQITNFLRGKYLSTWGNHPEHIQRWSRRRFASLVARHCQVLSVRSSFPWTIVLAEIHDKY